MHEQWQPVDVVRLKIHGDSVRHSSGLNQRFPRFPQPVLSFLWQKVSKQSRVRQWMFQHVNVDSMTKTDLEKPFVNVAAVNATMLGCCPKGYGLAA